MSHSFCIVWSLLALLIQFRFTEIDATDCGTVDFVDPKISRGTATVRGAWPFVAALFYAEQSAFICGGTLITAKNVLTGTRTFFSNVSIYSKSRYISLQLLTVYIKSIPLKSSQQKVSLNIFFLILSFHPI